MAMGSIRERCPGPSARLPRLGGLRERGDAKRWLPHWAGGSTASKEQEEVLWLRGGPLTSSSRSRCAGSR